MDSSSSNRVNGMNGHQTIRITLSFKLFGAFFLILAIVVGAMQVSRYIFAMNFENYIHQMELAKLDRLVPELLKEYRAHNGWHNIAGDFQRWNRLIRLAPETDHTQPPPDGFEPPKGMPPGPPLGAFLMDARHQPIIGMPEPNDQQQLIALDVDGTIVGWLGLRRHEPFKSGPPAALMKRQTRQLYLLGGAVIVLTALIALMFSRHLLKPIQRLTQGTKQLADRNFAVRIAATTRDELGQLAEHFNAMAQTLEKYEAMRRQWLTDISHELRTPLAVLRAEIEALQDGIREPNPDNLASLHAEILRISKLVEDLHLISMADSDKLILHKQRIFPYAILDDIAEGYRTRLGRRQIKLNLTLNSIKGIPLEGDAHRLGQVFTNILDNAFKYVQPPGTLKISAKADTDFVTLYFQDSGPGVDQVDLPRLFDRLYRADPSRSRKTGGSGLGLSICRYIIDHHDGKIWAQHSPMGGLSIGIRLPLMKKTGRSHGR